MTRVQLLLTLGLSALLTPVSNAALSAVTGTANSSPGVSTVYVQGAVDGKTLPPIAPGKSAVAEAFAPIKRLSDIFDLVEKIMRIGAYLVGGAWVYFNYFKGRTHEARLEVKVLGEFLPVSKVRLAKFTTQIKNVGLSKVELFESGSGVRIEGYDLGTEGWTFLGAYSIFTGEGQWIEPAETLEDQLLVPMGTSVFVAYRAQMLVNYGEATWEASTVFADQELINHES
jgi:hypothetical protein